MTLQSTDNQKLFVQTAVVCKVQECKIEEDLFLLVQWLTFLSEEERLNKNIFPFKFLADFQGKGDKASKTYCEPPN